MFWTFRVFFSIWKGEEGRGEEWRTAYSIGEGFKQELRQEGLQNSCS